jgi:hypothetical protein
VRRDVTEQSNIDRGYFERLLCLLAAGSGWIRREAMKLHTVSVADAFRTRSVLLLATFLVSATLEGSFIYGVSGYTTEILTVNTSTGDGALLSDHPGTQPHGLAFDPLSGLLYSNAGGTLWSTDPATGLTTAIGAIGYSTVAELAFDPGNRILYGIDVASNSVITLDTSTGAGAFVGNHGISTMVGLAFDTSSGFLAATNASGLRSLFMLDPSDASVISSVPISATIQGLAYDAANDRYYGVDGDLLNESQLYTIEKDGTIAAVGDGVGYNGVFGLAPSPEPGALVLLGSCFLLAGLRRRPRSAL